MAILDKLVGVGEAVRDKVKETFGELSAEADRLDDTVDEHARSVSALAAHRAYAVLGLAEGATLADVRDAYRALARHHYPLAARDGLYSDAQRTFDRLLEALELLEEHLVPLAPSVSGTSGVPSPPPAHRKRATARKPRG